MDLKMQLSRAIALAAKEHVGQYDKGGAPYILHPIRVMQAVAPDVRAMTVAILHDVIEDCGVTDSELLGKGFDLAIVDAVVLLSRPPAGAPDRPTYREFVQAIADADGIAGDLARKVKTADLRDNLSVDRMAALSPQERGIAKRYKKALRILKEEEIPGVVFDGKTDRRGRLCMCDRCKQVSRCTPSFDFYTMEGESDGPLYCEGCYRAEYAERLSRKENPDE